MAYFDRIIRKLSRWLSWVAVVALVAIMFLTSADVTLRFFGRPIPGTFEVVGFLGAVVISFALAYTQILQGHVAVEVVVSRLSQRKQAVIDSITFLLSIGIFSLIAWQSVVFATDLWLAGEVSPTEQIPFYPFVYGVGFGSAVLSLVLLLNFFESLSKAVRK